MQQEQTPRELTMQQEQTPHGLTIQQEEQTTHGLQPLMMKVKKQNA